MKEMYTAPDSSMWRHRTPTLDDDDDWLSDAEVELLTDDGVPDAVCGSCEGLRDGCARIERGWFELSARETSDKPVALVFARSPTSVACRPRALLPTLRMQTSSKPPIARCGACKSLEAMARHEREAEGKTAGQAGRGL